MNVSEIVCYDLVKESILRRGFMEDNIKCHFTSAVVAGKKTSIIIILTCFPFSLPRSKSIDVVPKK